MRGIKKIIKAQKVNMGGILLDQPLPTNEINQIDPFLLLHHWKHTYPGNQKQAHIGVAPHPHKGFSPVTFIFKGGVLHQDSEGNKGVIHAGGTQWMNSGSGIIHSERPSKELAKHGGEFEIIQLWVNSPMLCKMDPPSYQPLTHEETPIIKSDDGLIQTGIVTGKYDNKQGKINASSEVIALRVDIKKGGVTSFNLPANHNVFIYQLDGQLKINHYTTTKEKDLSWFKNEEGSITVEGLQDTRAIILSGKALNEPIKSYGPFVMNTQQELLEAVHDYENGVMGELKEVFN